LNPWIPDAWISAVRNWAAKQPDVSEVYLFGSRAKGFAKASSDLDIALIVNPRSEHDDAFTVWFFNADRWSAELQSLVPVEIDLDIGNPDISDVVVGPAIVDHGIQIYKRDESP